ncbi:hypothetical protein [Fodinicola feengrottensis]|uniref:hypothetical protein n=1 Tax=Fodinicola feengrottensis TaxID=435914 RepID=UPI0013D132F2|nr:hypothetical protein [Fodinicola feengrottensis]
MAFQEFATVTGGPEVPFTYIRASFLTESYVPARCTQVPATGATPESATTTSAASESVAVIAKTQ